MISRPATAGSSIRRLPVEGLRRQEQGLPPALVLLLEVGVEEERGERGLLAVVAREPWCARFWLEPEREIDREMAVDSLGLHRLDDFERVRYRGRVNLAVLVEITVVDADKVDAVLGEHLGLGAQVVAFLARGSVDSPEPDRIARLLVDELRAFDADKSAVAGGLFIQFAQVDSARARERVGLGIEDKPAPVQLGHAPRRGGELVGFQRSSAE